MTAPSKIKKVLSLSQQRKWTNWSTVLELSDVWMVSKRRVQQILKSLDDQVDKGWLITIDGKIEPQATIRPIFKLLR